MLIGRIVSADELLFLKFSAPGILPPTRDPLVLNVGADVKIEFNEQRAVIALLDLELVDLV